MARRRSDSPSSKRSKKRLEVFLPRPEDHFQTIEPPWKQVEMRAWKRLEMPDKQEPARLEGIAPVSDSESRRRPFPTRPRSTLEIFESLSKRFHPALERNSMCNFEAISRDRKRCPKSHLAGTLGLETISILDRRGLEETVETAARKFPDGRIGLVSRLLILETISRHRLEALPPSCQIQAGMRLS